MITIEKLEKYGADTKSGLERCVNNETLYLRLVCKCLEDKAFEELDEGDGEKVFLAAHSLKGTTGNLSLTPLYTPLCTLTELLRKDKRAEHSALVKQIKEEKEKLLQLINS